MGLISFFKNMPVKYYFNENRLGVCKKKEIQLSFVRVAGFGIIGDHVIAISIGAYFVSDMDDAPRKMNSH